MASTLVGPIRIPQINRNYYVGEPMQRNIQQAVTFAIADSNAGNVIVPQDYTGSDTVAAVTGGSPTVYIIDERHGQRQAYLWYDNAYIYEPTHASGGVLTPQLNNYAYVGFGTNPTIQGVIDNFAVLPTLTITIIIEPSYTGGEVISNLTNGDPGIVISDQRTAQWQNYNWNGIQFVPTDFEPLGQIIAGTIIADSIEGGEATFAECIVDNSPVRTFANTPDTGPGDGMLWPDIGIAVSDGNAWGPSLAAADVALTSSPSTIFAGIVAAPTINIVDDFQTTGTISLLNAYTTNLSSGAITSFFIGQNESPLNYIQLGFQFIGPGSASNIGIIGFPGGSQATFDNSGNWHIPGVLTAGSKAFDIPHPTDPGTRLKHGCLEGPEFGIYYRGEGVTKNGWAEITLPDYFESLAMTGNRTVLLTALFEDEDEPIGALAASRVIDGKFKIWSSVSAQKFYWEVKAVRGDIDALKVEFPENIRNTN